MSEKTDNYIKNLSQRASDDKLENQIMTLKKFIVIDNILNSIPIIFLILNEYRQVVYMNKAALEFAEIEDISEITGKRPGEVFHCIRAKEGKGGCGTSKVCPYCGCLNVILKSQEGNPAINDCRLVTEFNKSHILRIWSHPLKINNDQFYSVSIKDIGHEKRRRILERIFFHDLLNIINGLTLSLDLLKYSKNIDENKKYIKNLYYFANILTEQILSQQLLNDAEQNNLTLNYITLHSIDFLKNIINHYEDELKSKNIKILIDPNSESIDFITDKTILSRIIDNMIKNALEAVVRDSIIKIGCIVGENKLKFWVNNQGYIPQKVQFQIFQRTFSTKGPNRGLGTYSMKLLSSYLNGNVNFTTSEENGTTFEISVPLNPKSSESIKNL